MPTSITPIASPRSGVAAVAAATSCTNLTLASASRLRAIRRQ